MKRKMRGLLLCATTPLIGSAAFAQSTGVTLFGVLDTNVARYSASGQSSVVRMGVDGLSSSRWGMRGQETLAGDLRAGFWLEGGFRTDTGALGATNTDNRTTGNTSGLFGRRATLSLTGPAGELRLGRDFTPVALGGIDFSLYGPTSTGHLGALSFPVFNSVTHIRISNGINYLSPVLAGFHAHVAWAPGENPDNADGRYLGGRVTWRSGPLLLGAGTARTRYVSGDQTHTLAGARYELGDLRLMTMYARHLKSGVDQQAIHLAVAVVTGNLEWRLGGTDTRLKGSDGARQLMAGVIYNLSKRTALYADASQIDNKGKGTTFGIVEGLKPATPGGKSTGMEIGVRHSF